MKSLITKSLEAFTRKILTPIFFLFLALLPLMAFNSSENHLAPKLKFKSMLFKKADLDPLINTGNVDHFVFQCKNINNANPRHSYGLVVYVIDKNGNQMNNNITLLIDAGIQPPAGANDRDDHIQLANYKMTIAQYNNIISTSPNFTYLKFEALPKTDTKTYPNYVTYLVYPVDANEDPTFKGTVKHKFINDNYLNPSPPAPPLQ